MAQPSFFFGEIASKVRSLNGERKGGEQSLDADNTLILTAQDQETVCAGV